MSSTDTGAARRSLLLRAALVSRIGQPVIIPGDMGRYSYVLKGGENAMKESFGSSCHGAGRRLSRRKAKEAARGRAIFQELLDAGVVVMSERKSTVAEEIPEAYKDVAEVVDVVHGAGLANALLMPPEGAVLELIPARSEINNMFNDSLSSQCGFTMFWYLAAMRGLRYYGVLLHNFAWEDVCVAPPRQVRAQVRRLVRESGRSRLRDEL